MEEENLKKKKNFTIILAIVTVLIYVAIFVLMDKDDRESARRNAEIVTNYSEFYTVSACASKYIDFLAMKDADSLLNVLSDSFKKENNVDATNVTRILPIISQGTTFSANRMYYEELPNGLYKYYIRGFLEVGGLDMTSMQRTETYLIVYLDKENNLFSAEPYEGEEYKEGVYT